MKITVIGYWHAYPEANEATSCYLLEKDNFRLLIDCGSGAVSQLQNFCQIEDINAVVLSHYHADHMADVGVLRYAAMMKTLAGKMTEPLVIYGHAFDEEKFQSLSYKQFVRAVAYREEEPLKVGPFTIQFLRTVHPVPCFAMRITDGKHVIAYTADTEMFAKLPRFIQNCDLLIAECSFFQDEQKAGGHLSSLDVAQLARDGNAKHVLLTHLPHFGSHARLLKEVKSSYRGEVDVATTGWTKLFR